MNISVASALFVASGLFFFGGAIVVLGVVVYIGHTKGDILSDHFKNSSPVITIPALIDKGLRGKTRLVCSVSSVVTFPRFFLKHGIVNAEDLENFPKDLRRKLVALQWALLTTLGGIMALGVIAMWN
ncbi:hypothetical protein [Pseudomonas sp. C2B4]|uniref:hypothetical protein n=1 Tax=Pseudomonas sp. C2B4 TaxID=2735270 RepID=UPI0015865435|nr:hypothetical protein [Pseudomonas sp. C2B4]NUU33634.1 hypothetical protein [Pseudomonas sp. C2B4]